MIYIFSLCAALCSMVSCTSTDAGSYTANDPTPTIAFRVGDVSITSTITMSTDADDEVAVTVATNQDSETILASIDAAGEAWCDFSQSGNTITLTTKARNVSDGTYSGSVTVTVGEGGDKLTKSFDIEQPEFVFAAVSVQSEPLTFDNMSEEELTAQITTNQAESTISYSVTKGAEYFDVVEVDGTTIKVKTLGVNQTEANYEGEVTITVGVEGNQDTAVLSLVQGYETIASVDTNSVKMLANIGRSAEVKVTTNQTTLSAEVATEDQANFTTSIEGSVVTITALGDNETGDNITGSVTITTGDAAPFTIAVKQLPVDIGVIYDDNAEDGVEGGIVYWIADDYSSAMIVTTTKPGTTVTYSTETSTETTTDDDGYANTQQIMARTTYSAETYPALAWAVAFGDGWYLPSINELEVLLLAAYNNSAIVSASTDTFSLTGAHYSSTETSSKHYQGKLENGLFVSSTANKENTSHRTERAIKKLTLSF